MSWITTWRITKSKYHETAFDGEGARLHPGRWNSRGVPMVYTAESQALAMLELLVHLESDEILFAHFVVVPVRIPEAIIMRLDAATLPTDWRAPMAPRSTRDLVDRWIASGQSLALGVPSVLVPTESNYLLNPRHANRSRLEIGTPVSLSFDHRLAK
ncbi:MAG: RES family NAD+ phosphorylase [Thiotrichales bacterium]